jgi:hypothetical protein
MAAYRRTYRVCPLSLTVVLPPLFVWFFWPAWHDGRLAVWQLGPLLALFTYAMLVCLCNRAQIMVNRRGAWLRKGPFPVGPQTPPVLREQIAQVYVRQAVYRVKGASKLYLVAGVRRLDGACLDLTEEFVSDELVRQQATAIAAALDWQDAIVELQGEVLSLEQPLLYAYLCWAGALMLSLLWVGIAGALNLGG